MTDVLIPTDTARSRLTGRERSSSDPDSNPDEIGLVDGRVRAFRALFPDSIIDASDVEQIGDNAWRVTARVWKDRANQHELPDSTGTSVRFVNLDGHVSEAFPVESAQTIAIGRALRFLTSPAEGGNDD